MGGYLDIRLLLARGREYREEFLFHPTTFPPPSLLPFLHLCALFRVLLSPPLSSSLLPNQPTTTFFLLFLSLLLPSHFRLVLHSCSWCGIRQHQIRDQKFYLARVLFLYFLASFKQMFGSIVKSFLCSVRTQRRRLLGWSKERGKVFGVGPLRPLDSLRLRLLLLSSTSHFSLFPFG